MEGAQADADTIVDAIEAYRLSDNNAMETQEIWQKNGVTIGVYDAAGRRVTVMARGPFSKGAPHYPYGVHTALPDQSWFPAEKMNQLWIVYEGEAPVSATYTGQDGRYSLICKKTENGFAATPLDAVITAIETLDRQQVRAVIGAETDHPVVVVSDDESARICSAAKTGAGFLVETLYMPAADLPAELLG